MDKVLYLLGLYNLVEGNNRNGRKMKEIWQWEREAGKVILLVSVNTETGRQSTAQVHKYTLCIS